MNLAQKEECPPESSSAASGGQPEPSLTMQRLLTKQKFIENYDFLYCDESSKYEKVAKIGQGTFG